MGVKDRRTGHPLSNIDEIAPVPLFIKAPGQPAGARSAYARTIDVVPTIADILNFRLPYRADGRSAFSRAVRRRRLVRMIKRDFNGTITVSAQGMEKRRRALRAGQVRSSARATSPPCTPASGPTASCSGRPVAQLARAAPGKVRDADRRAADMRNVAPGSLVPPPRWRARDRGQRGRRDLAVAVNGRIEAVGRTFYLRGSAAGELRR